MLGERFSGNRVYVSIGNNGFFQETSKDNKPGFKEYDRKDGEKGYRKEYAFIEGRLSGASIRETVIGKRVSLIFTDDNICEDVVVEFSMLTQKGRVAGYPVHLAHIIENIPTDRVLQISCNRTEKTKDGKYLKSTFFVKDISKEGKDAFIKTAHNRDLNPFPPFEKVTKFKIESYDTTAFDEAVYNTIEKEFERINREGKEYNAKVEKKSNGTEQTSNNNTQYQSSPRNVPKSQPAPSSDDEEEVDDLPF